MKTELKELLSAWEVAGPVTMAALPSYWQGTTRLTTADEELRAVFPVLEAIQWVFMAWSLGRGDIGGATRNWDVLMWLDAKREAIEQAISDMLGPRGPA